MPLRHATELALCLALAVVLGMVVKLIQLPYGGSINLSPLPLLVLAFRHGVKLGCLAGALYGVLDFILNPFFFHPLQVVLDYPVAFALLGMAGIGGNRDGDEGWMLRLRSVPHGCPTKWPLMEREAVPVMRPVHSTSSEDDSNA